MNYDFIWMRCLNKLSNKIMGSHFSSERRRLTSASVRKNLHIHFTNLTVRLSLCFCPLSVFICCLSSFPSLRLWFILLHCSIIYLLFFLSLPQSMSLSFFPLFLRLFILPSLCFRLHFCFLSLSLHQEIGDGAEEEAGRRGEEEEGGGGEEDSGGCWVCHCRHPADRSPLLAFVVLTQELFADGSLDGFIYLRLGLGQRCKITYWAPEMTLQKWFITAPTAVVCWLWL